MFIELTDLLRCPAEHDEAYLVLLPDDVEARTVLRGELGCPVCGESYPIVDGIVRLGDRERHPDGPPSRLSAEAMDALLGLDGPGGYVVLVGGAAVQAADLAARLEGVQLVAVNPPAGAATGDRISVVEAGRIPLKRQSVRGVVLDALGAADPAWLDEADRVVLPGLRVVGEGAAPARAGWEVLGRAGAEAWVVRRS